MQKYVCTKCGNRSTIPCRTCPMCEAKDSYTKFRKKKKVANKLRLWEVDEDVNPAGKFRCTCCKNLRKEG